MRADLLRRFPLPEFELLESLGDTLLCPPRSAKLSTATCRTPPACLLAIFAAYRSLLQSNYTFFFTLIALVYDLGARLDPPFSVPFFRSDALNEPAHKTLGDAFKALVGGLYVDGQHATRSTGGSTASSPSHHLARFAAAREAVRGPSLCACRKHALSACANRLGLRYEIKTEQVSSSRLERMHESASWTAYSTAKKAAEFALFDLDPSAAESVVHFCGLVPNARLTLAKRPADGASEAGPSHDI
ncbi:hypothetical protein JCM3774_001993 [Rhodotorula dairenensis]